MSFRLGKYEVGEEIGRGGFATVYRAVDTDLGRRPVALKVLHPEHTATPGFVRRFQREAATAANLQHPNIVTILERGEIDGRYYIAMELVDGPTLREHLATSGAIAWAEARRIARQIADALAYAHQHGVVHRDVKPSNILLHAQRGAVLTDFGFARIVAGGDGPSISITDTVVGTFSYMPIEVWDGEKAGPSADVYALGCILYEMVTGQTLFAGDRPSQVLRAHDRGASFPAQWPSDLPADVVALIAGAVAREASDRIPDGASFLQRLESIALSPELSKQHPATDRPEQGARTRRLRNALVGLGVFAILGFFGGRLLMNSINPAVTEIAEPTATATPSATLTLLPTVTSTSTPSLTPTPTPTAASSPPATEVPSAPTAPVAGESRLFELPSGQTTLMNYVPAGQFAMGMSVESAYSLCQETRDDCQRAWYQDEAPPRLVEVDAFWLDRTEVTNAQYAACVAAGVCEPPRLSGSFGRAAYFGDSTHDDYPVIYVSWTQADAYCQWRGGRLPTEAEWEKAARGFSEIFFPWGDQFDGTLTNYCDASCLQEWADDAFDDGYVDTAPVGSFPDGAGPFGHVDMAGNVWEWVADWYASDYYVRGPSANPMGPETGTEKVIRGGSWQTYRHVVRTTGRDTNEPGAQFFDVGFRCAADAGEP